MSPLPTILALAFLLAAAQASNGWIYSGPKNLPLGGPMPSSHGLDLDGNGSEDLSVGFTFYITMDYPTGAGAWFFSGNSANSFVLSADGTAVPVTFMQWEPNPNPAGGTWKRGSFSISSYSVNYREGTCTGWQGPWADIDLGHIGVLFPDDSGLLRQAWVRVLLPDDTLCPIILDWWYAEDPFPSPSARDMMPLPTGQEIELTLDGLHTGLSYVLETTDDLIGGVWTTSQLWQAESAPVTVSDTATGPRQFWRIKRVP